MCVDDKNRKPVCLSVPKVHQSKDGLSLCLCFFTSVELQNDDKVMPYEWDSALSKCDFSFTMLSYCLSPLGFRFEGLNNGRKIPSLPGKGLDVDGFCCAFRCPELGLVLFAFP